jgi:uncharacterized Zn-binding protein involved in type VI secretion
MQVSNLTSICSGHNGWPPRNVVSGSTDVFIENSGAVRIGDFWEVHCKPDEGCHGGTSITGSPTVFVNDLSLCRVGDYIDCGSTILTGNLTVFAD